MKKLIPDFLKMKTDGEKITMITAYDYPQAQWSEEAKVDMILVGDSLGMVVLGYEDTVKVTIDDMVHHTKAVVRGAKETFVVADLPFMTYATVESALLNATRLIQEGGADAVKLEGGEYVAPIVKVLVKSGIPVVGHIGLTPQTATQLGGFKVQGRNLESARQLIIDAKAIQDAGAFAITLEAIPKELAECITADLSIPTIGIGAGNGCDGQVLVMHDMIGMFDRFKPKFVKQYMDVKYQAVNAIQSYIKEVKDGSFPQAEHSFSVPSDVIEKLYGS